MRRSSSARSQRVHFSNRSTGKASPTSARRRIPTHGLERRASPPGNPAEHASPRTRGRLGEGSDMGQSVSRARELSPHLSPGFARERRGTKANPHYHAVSVDRSPEANCPGGGFRLERKIQVAAATLAGRCKNWAQRSSRKTRQARSLVRDAGSGQDGVMEVLVTGATGFVGRHAADELARAGHSVRCLVRPGTDPSDLARGGHRVVRGEVLDQASLARAVDGVEAVVHVAGLVSARSFREMRRVNVEGVARIAAEAARARTRRFLLVSSLAAAGPSRSGRAVRESDPARPVSRYGLTKLLGERAAARALGSAVPLTVIRPPAVYGPRDRGIHGFFDAAARGVRLRIGSRPRRVSIVHGEDLARAMALALASESAAGKTYFVANSESYEVDDLIARIASAVGGRTLSVRLPDPLVRAAGALAEEVARWRGAVPLFSRDKACEFLAAGWVCDSSRAAAELSWRPRWTLDEGLAQTAAWYREHGWIPVRTIPA